MRALFSYFPIPLRKNDTENISLIELWSLRGFVDTLTANENYPFGDSGDLQFSIQMELSENRKRFFEVFAPFIESPSTFKYFQKKEDRES